MSCISNNSKTLQSVDFTTDCPKRRNGNACKYCYVEDARDMGFNAKKVINYTSYNNEIKRFTEKKIEKLNSIGGLRLFSFGDYMTEHYNDVLNMLNDAKEKNLKVKVITKVPEFVTAFANHPAISVINVSVDNVGDGMDIEVAKLLKVTYSNVKIRTLVMKDEDIEAVKFADVFTFNHAKMLKRKYGYKKYNKTEVAEWNKKLDGRVCCSTGKCIDCPLKCSL